MKPQLHSKHLPTLTVIQESCLAIANPCKSSHAARASASVVAEEPHHKLSQFFVVCSACQGETLIFERMVMV